MRIPLQFCFKGDRDYIHGTDMFQSICTELVKTGLNISQESVDMSIHAIARSNPILCDDQGMHVDDHVLVNFYLGSGDGQHRFVLVKGDGTVDCRYAYDELQFTRPAVMNVQQSSITLEQVFQGTLIEKVVALTKAIHQHLFAGQEGKWYFTRVKFSHPFFYTAAPSVLQIVFRKNFNYKLTMSDIYVDHQKAGSVYFSLL